MTTGDYNEWLQLATTALVHSHCSVTMGHKQAHVARSLTIELMHCIIRSYSKWPVIYCFTTWRLLVFSKYYILDLEFRLICRTQLWFGDVDLISLTLRVWSQRIWNIWKKSHVSLLVLKLTVKDLFDLGLRMPASTIRKSFPHYTPFQFILGSDSC